MSSGTRLHSVSGDCERPGVYEYPYGVRIGRVLPYREARDPEDEKHIHPLQLDVIERIGAAHYLAQHVDPSAAP